MNRVLVVFSDGLLSELDSARGLVSRSAWIRQAVEDKLMKEAVDCPVCFGHGWVGVGAGSRQCERCNGKRKVLPKEAVAPLVPDFDIAQPKPKARRKKGKGVDLAFEAMGAIVAAAQIPDRCNRGACTGTINPVSGRCLHCNQTPLKESK